MGPGTTREQSSFPQRAAIVAGTGSPRAGPGSDQPGRSLSRGRRRAAARTADGPHDTARFTWELVRETDGTVPVAGSDVITPDLAGQIMSVLGFLDRVPAGT